MKADFNIAIRWGIIGGIIMAIMAVLTYMFYEFFFGSFMVQIIYGLFSFGLMLFFPIWGGVAYKRSADAPITYVQAFIAVFTIFALVMLFSSVTSYIINHVIDPNYGVMLKEYVIKNTTSFMERQGMSDEQIEEAVKKNFNTDQFDFSLLNILKGLGKGLAFGAVLSLIVAIFVRRPVGNSLVQDVENIQ